MNSSLLSIEDVESLHIVNLIVVAVSENEVHRKEENAEC